jgi:hypothetical protein
VGKRGPSGDPIERKRKRGTDRADRSGGKKTLKAVAPVNTPEVLDLTVEQALERALDMAHWICDTDTPQVATAREAAELYAELKADPKTKPADRIAALKTMSVEFARLGFNPGERSALGLAEVQAKSKMEELRDRAAARDEGKQGRTG